jgi:hypothetical protein
MGVTGPRAGATTVAPNGTVLVAGTLAGSSEPAAIPWALP